MAKKLFYKIGEACKKVDVQPYVLRYWETEFDLLSPDKSKSGQRVYTEEDLAVIRRIKELLYDEGYTTVGAKKKLQAELAAAKNGTSEADALPQPESSEPAAEAQSQAGPEPALAKPTVARAAAKSVTQAEDPAEDPAAFTTDADLLDGVRAALKQARDILHRLDSAGST